MTWYALDSQQAIKTTPTSLHNSITATCSIQEDLRNANFVSETRDHAETYRCQSEILCLICVKQRVKRYKNDQTHLYRFFYE